MYGIILSNREENLFDNPKFTKDADILYISYVYSGHIPDFPRHPQILNPILTFTFLATSRVKFEVTGRTWQTTNKLT